MVTKQYDYATRRDPRGGYVAEVTCREDGKAPFRASYQTGFANRSAAYRYARGMAKAMNRNHAWAN